MSTARMGVRGVGVRRWLQVGLVVAAVLASGTATTGSSPAPADPRALTGEWSPPFSEGGPDFLPQTDEESARYPTAVSAAVLPDGRVLYWNGLENQEHEDPVYLVNTQAWARNSRARILDLRDGQPRWSVPEPEDGGASDMFCADQKFLPDGRLLIAGGTWWHDDPDLGPVGLIEVDGTRDTRIFDPATDRFRVVSPMQHPRWYPSLVTLPDGRVLALSGVARLVKNTNLTQVREPEVFDPATERWTALGASAERSLPLYPRVHLLPNGKVLYTASGQMWGPFGEGVDEATWSLLAWFDPVQRTWQDLGLPAYGVARSGTFSVLLPLQPPYDRAEILVGGGTLGTSPGTWVATPLTELIAFDGPTGTVRSRPGPMLNQRRWFSSGVLLPDGTVAVFSGGDVDAVIDPGLERAVRMAELYDPRTGSFRNLAPGRRDRTYHNSALLLPDGSVLVGGHSPLPHHYLRQDNTLHRTTGLTAPQYKDPSFEIYRPPYFFYGGQRPRLHGAPARVGYGERFEVKTPDARRVESAVLIRLPSTTHVIDADQRAVFLRVVRRGERSLVLEAPPHGAVAPPGPYYLFLNALTPQGRLPSEAAVVLVGGR